MRRTAATTSATPQATQADRRGRPARSSLHSRLLSRMLLISMVPLLVIGSLTLGSLWALSRSPAATAGGGDGADGDAAQAAARAVQADASGVADRIERVVAERVSDVTDWAAAPAVRGAARTAAVSTGDALADTPPDEIDARFAEEGRLRPGSSVERYLRSATERVPAFTQVMLTERNGLVVGAASRPGSTVQRDRTAWRRAWQDGAFVGGAAKRGPGTGSVIIAARVEDPGSAEGFGVVLATLDLAALQDEADRAAGDGATVTLLTGDGALLAETGSGHRGSRLLDRDVELTGDRAKVVDAALAAEEPGSAEVGGTVAGFAPLGTADGPLTGVLDRAGAGDAATPAWTALVERPGDAGAAAAAPAGPAARRRP
jgi:hypothetical protein